MSHEIETTKYEREISKLAKICGVQLLRTGEINTLKAVRRVLSERRKHGYRKDILDHICADNVAPFMNLERDESNLLPERIHRWLTCLSQTKLVIKCGNRKKMPEYTGNGVYNKHHNARPYRSGIDDVYVFDGKLVNEVVKLLHTIDYDGGDRLFRTALSLMDTVKYTTKRFTYEDLKQLNTYPSIVSSNKEHELVRKWFKIDDSEKRHYYQISEYGFYVAHVWTEITKLIDKGDNHEVVLVVDSNAGTERIKLRDSNCLRE